MDFIDNQKILFDLLIDIYDDENFLRELDFKKRQIIQVFEQIFEEEAVNFELVYKNALQNGKYYKIESRIKTTVSLREKFYRRNIGLELIRSMDLNSENIEHKAIRKKIRQAYCLLDDIIGIRIVTELKADCMSALNLINNRISVFNQGGIFFQTDFDSQPAIMDNGLEIIKLKGIYDDKNAFELQIKSKIDSAWGDIDHKLFYKDYNSSNVKDSLQVSMNNIGELLNQLEKFLYDLRETNNEIEDSDYDQYLVDYLFEHTSLEINEKLNITYDFKRILDPVIFFCKDLNLGPDIGSIDFSYFEAVVDFKSFATYEAIRKYNFDYVLLETIFINCVIKVEDQDEKDIDYNRILKHYFVLLSKYNEKKIRETNPKLEPNYYKVIYKKMMQLMAIIEDPMVLFDYNIYKKIRLIDKIIIDVIVENEMDISTSRISKIFTLFAFNSGHRIARYAYDEDKDYIGVLTKVKHQVEAMEHPELLKFFNQVILSIAKDIDSKEIVNG